MSAKRAGKQPARAASQTGRELADAAAEGAGYVADKTQQAGSAAAEGASRIHSRVTGGVQAASEQLPFWLRRGVNLAYAGACGIGVGTLAYFYAPVIVPSASYAANQLGFAGATGALTTAAIWAKPNLPKGLLGASAAAFIGAALTVTFVPGVTAGYLTGAVLGSAIIGYNMADHEEALKNILFYGVLAYALYASFNVLAPMVGMSPAGAAAA